ncbi:MAG: type III-A CRISPR-associated RAMP protein Csm5 [Candidatus Muirbacterium halophilum]|nr:type III-A CRISPR-associated RAMP protein Csm5 [Candidatus Muirbacterium halophilum]MCK9475922.1 type III-A CRISPR-associated RAMP protein Csm5 [Candidatus Muirbacterium halophilum]
MDNSYKIRLTTLSPLSIKSGEEIRFYEIFEGEEYVYFINKNLLLKKLSKAGENLDITFINKMTNMVMHTGNTKLLNLQTFLKEECGIALEEKLDKELLEELSYYKIKKKVSEVKNTIYPFIRDAYKKPFIPGSSIKGAIRTSILASIFDNQIEDNNKNYNNVNWKSNGKYNALVNRFFVKDNIVNFEGAQDYKQKKYDAKNDFFRFIQISDAKLIGEDNSELINFKVHGMKSNSGTPLFEQEVIPQNTEFEFSVKLNKQGLESWKKEFARLGIQKNDSFPTNFDDILFFTKAFSDKIITKEKKYWNNNKNLSEFYNSIEDELELIRIGNGSGAHSITLVNELDTIGFQIHGKKGVLNNPKTRKMVTRLNGSMEPFGWCKMEEIE